MKLRPLKKLMNISLVRDRRDWGHVTLRREGDGLDDKEQDEINIDLEEIDDIEDIEDDVQPE